MSAPSFGRPTFYTADQFSAQHGVKVLVHAPSGAGKTVLCATAPAPIVLSAEAGVLSLRKSNLERMYGVNTPGVCYVVPVLHVGSLDDLRNYYRWLTTSAEARQSVGTVCLDSVSEVAQQVLAKALATVRDPRQAYQELSKEVSDLLRQYRDLPGYHVYFSAQQGKEKDGGRYTAMMPGQQLQERVPYFFDEVFSLEQARDQNTGQLYRYLLTQLTPNTVAKDRSGALDPAEYPSLTNVFSKILGV